MTADREKVIILIKKLLTMAEHANSNEHEALAAAKQAESLMRKYNVDYAEAIAKEIKSGAGMTTGDVVATAKDNGTPTIQTPQWAQYLSVRVGNLYDTPVRLVRVRTSLGLEQAIRFHGYTYDVEVAVWTFDMLVKTINRLCKAYRKHPYYVANGRAVMNAYRLGVVHSILGTLDQMAFDKRVQETSSGVALVWIKKEAIVKQYGAFDYQDAKVTKTTRDGLAYLIGRQDGRAVQVQGVIKAEVTQRTINST